MNLQTYQIQRVTTEQELADALSVRRVVFIEEQEVPEELEIDEHDTLDSGTIHFVVYREGNPVGASRLRTYAPGVGKIERVAVAKTERGTGLGRQIMLAMEELAKQHGYDSLKLNAQTQAQRFYEKLGYEPFGDLFDDAGIEHIAMVKSIRE
ncbi:GNAT family N-acetyltransferase [Brevibacillus sp. HB1.2]|uniref:GNAT family N-acetyltransferase n=1 Tax=unclassified Brevibacillus TaxID=2684853 RepID=UPI00037FF897|nr:MULTISPECIES: GNAT family N-acetyltransferase [unclassified Brevibacillus]ATF14578.1 N-acetyltransferase [Brevibacillus brevis X23]NRS16268.1 GNAT family N-acetyltransferase [Brevibacillus sp. HB1.4B]NTU20190.1 GNAT family N-acetyltransferase [Brevibacillus sp. HB1.2]NTU29430.1 GNAT family N-acetyltransferase [Brevibacillus sp. HB1.1]